MDISGKTAIVTGAGGGIGRALAVMLAREGAKLVVAADINEGAARETVALIEKAGGAGQALRVDVADVKALRAAFETAAAAGPLQIVCNNAGVMSGAPPFPDTPLESMLRTVAINFTGMIAGTHIGVEIMRRQGTPGAIVNTSSIAGIGAGLPPDPTYAATKAGILMFTRSCGALQQPFGIRVNAVLPGITDTNIMATTGPDNTVADWLAPALTAMKILPTERIAATVLDLISDESKAGVDVVVENEMLG